MAAPQATCTIEVGLFKKKPCAQPAVSACANCEQPLCAQHIFPEINDAGRKTGKFVCKECSEAAKEYAKKMVPPAPAAEKAPKYAAPAAPAKAAAPEQKKEEKKPQEKVEEKKEDLGAIVFTPPKKE
jgi:recombinational DNA repair protein (RecF pathway)